VGCEPFQEAVEGFASEVPVEGLGGGVVAVLEDHQPVGRLIEVGEVAGLDQLDPDNGEDDLDLVEPAGVDGQVYQLGGGAGSVRPFDRSGAVVRGAAVDAPEDPGRRWRRARLMCARRTPETGSRRTVSSRSWAPRLYRMFTAVGWQVVLTGKSGRLLGFACHLVIVNTS
jgi:hypothetical protein